MIILLNKFQKTLMVLLVSHFLSLPTYSDTLNNPNVLPLNSDTLNEFGLIIFHNNITKSDSIKESRGTEFKCPENKLMIGMEHSGDENGNTKYKCAGLFALSNNEFIKSQNVIITPNEAFERPIKESNNIENLCTHPTHVMLGRRHSGDENGSTSILCGRLHVLFTVSDELEIPVQLEYRSLGFKPAMRQSRFNDECLDNGSFMIGRHHKGDENGYTKIKCGTLNADL
ncbi:MAG: hypothetical protein P8Y42_09730 [Exilibacterium sp.]